MAWGQRFDADIHPLTISVNWQGLDPQSTLSGVLAGSGLSIRKRWHGSVGLPLGFAVGCLSIVLRFLENSPVDDWGWAASGGRFGRRLIAALLAAAVSGAAGGLVLAAAFGNGDAPLSLTVAAILSSSLFALGAVWAARAAIAVRQPGGGPQAKPASPDSVASKPALARAVHIDEKTVVRRRFDFPDRMAGPLAAGDRMLDRIHVGDRVAFLRAVSRACVRDAAPVGLTVRFDRSGAGDRQSLEPAAVILSPDASGGVQLLIACDVEQTALKTQTAADPEGSRLAMVSHELRTPLNAIIGFADLVRGDTLGTLPPDRQRDYADLIHDAATHLLSVVNAMLDVSKIGAGRYAINREAFDLERTVRDVAKMIAPRAQARGVHVNLHMEKTGAPAHADRRAVRQIVTNLLTNAVKFTPENGCVTIDAETSPDALVLRVSDTGIGIAPEDIDQLGRPFSQIDNSYTRQCEGTGLGLSLVKGLAALHGGTMQIESAPEIGTCVTVILPHVTAEAAASGNTDDRITPLRPSSPDPNEDNDKEIADAPRLFG